MTYFDESCYPRFLAVAVVKESQVSDFHLPHEIARLQMIDNLEEHPHRGQNLHTTGESSRTTIIFRVVLQKLVLYFRSFHDSSQFCGST